MVLTDLPGPGRMADLAQPGADPPHARDRDARGGDGAVRGQDRNADAQSDDARQQLDADGAHSTSSARTSPTCRRSSTRCWSSPILASKQDPFDPMEKAHAGSGRPVPGADRASAAASWSLLARVPALARSCWPCRQAWKLGAGERCRRRRQGRTGGDRRSVPSSPTSGTRCRERVDGAWPRTGCGCLASPAPRRPRHGLPGRPARRRLRVRRAWSAWRIPLRATVPAAVAECYTAGHPGGDDHRRLSGHRAEHRPADRARRARARASPVPNWTR